MSAPRPRLVVRYHAPLLQVLLVCGAALLVLIALWSAFELGRSRAGFDGAAARSERAKLQDRIDVLEDQLRSLHLKLAVYESDSTGQTRERTELSKTIGELQAQVARLSSDVAFYRGVVEQRISGDVVKVQQFHVVAGGQAREFKLRLVLGRPLRPDGTISGKARISIDGTGPDGAPVSYDLMQLAGVPGAELAFSLRYVQTLEQTVTLPAGFVPARSSIELLPARKDAGPVRESFLWTVEN